MGETCAAAAIRWSTLQRRSSVRGRASTSAVSSAVSQLTLEALLADIRLAASLQLHGQCPLQRCP